MFRSTRRRKAASSRNAQVSGAASSLPGPVSSFEECRLQFEVLSSYLECPLGEWTRNDVLPCPQSQNHEGVSEHEVAQAGESRMERARKMEKVSDECLLDRVVDLAEEVRYRQITPWALGSNDSASPITSSHIYAEVVIRAGLAWRIQAWASSRPRQPRLPLAERTPRGRDRRAHYAYPALPHARE
jgi:hypothetical protein